MKNFSPESYINRELSWLSFAQRVISLAAEPDLPLLERIKFTGIIGMLHDEFFMKRMSGLKRQIDRGTNKISTDGRTPEQEFDECRKVLMEQRRAVSEMLQKDLLPAMARAEVPIINYEDLSSSQISGLREYFRRSVMPILTPLAVDSEHPFPFISNLGLNLAVVFADSRSGRDRFVRIKVPDNRPRWVPVPDGKGFTPMEQIIAANLDLFYPSDPPQAIHVFRVTRGADGESDRSDELDETEILQRPGRIIEQVSKELKARRFAGVVRLQVEEGTSKKFARWLAKQLEVKNEETYVTSSPLALSDFLNLEVKGRDDLRLPRHDPVTHPRLISLPPDSSSSIFEEIEKGDILLHHPYHSFDSSVLRFIESAAVDPDVLAIKLTIYRTNADSPIVKALAEAARRGKQVAVLVEVTARFDEAPNIAWGRFLENEGVHVAYGVERLKTHVKLALVVREEKDRVRLYAHMGTGNYHTGTARVYEDLGILTCNPSICEEVAAVFNSLTGITQHPEYRHLLVAPDTMRTRFIKFIRREAENAAQGKPCGIDAKMNQLQDSEIIRELYRASSSGVPINLIIRGLCCLRPGVKGLSENIRVCSVVGRFLEHSRIFRFQNEGRPEYFIGSADWMKRNLNGRVETMSSVLDSALQKELDAILAVYEEDNSTAWDCGPDGVYVRREPTGEKKRKGAQNTFIRLAKKGLKDAKLASQS